MRKIFLKLAEDSDLYVHQHGPSLWHLRNKENDMCVVEHGSICRSIVHGVYLSDKDSLRRHHSKLLTARSYSRIDWS